MKTLRQCPRKYKFQYVDKVSGRANGSMLLGGAFGAAECSSDHAWIESGAPLETDEVLDLFSDEFEHRKDDEDLDWQDESVAKVKDDGVAALRVYHVTVPHLAAPIEAERPFRFTIEHEDIAVPFLGYIDVEREDGSVEDRKLSSRKMSPEAASASLQATAYLAGRRAEGNPAKRFVFDQTIKGTSPKRASTERKPPEVVRMVTERTDEELDHFFLNVVAAAQEIDWRLETDNWSYAPEGAWWCGQKWCSFWDECPGGGLLRQNVTRAVRNG